MDLPRATVSHFSIGSIKSSKTALATFSNGILFLKLSIYKVNADTPKILFSDDKDLLETYSSNLVAILVQTWTKFGAKVSKLCGCSFSQYNTLIFSLLIKAELHQHLLRVGRSASDRMTKLLKPSKTGYISPETRDVLEEIEKKFRSCQTFD